MKDYKAKIVDNKIVANNTYRIDIDCGQLLPYIAPGQFAMVRLNEGDKVLRRGFCIAHNTDNTISLYYAVVGQGTKALSSYKSGASLQVLLPLGNGFGADTEWLRASYKVSEYRSDNTKRTVVLVGGGLGIAGISKALDFANSDTDVHAYIGVRSHQHLYMYEHLKKHATHLTVCTDDGSYGYKGSVVDALDKDISTKNLNIDRVFSCGSHGMLKALNQLTQRNGIVAYMSGEPRMACGIGACLVCACDILQEDDTVSKKRGCVDGPVFLLDRTVFVKN